MSKEIVNGYYTVYSPKRYWRSWKKRELTGLKRSISG